MFLNLTFKFHELRRQAKKRWSKPAVCCAALLYSTDPFGCLISFVAVLQLLSAAIGLSPMTAMATAVSTASWPILLSLFLDGSSQTSSWLFICSYRPIPYGFLFSCFHNLNTLSALCVFSSHVCNHFLLFIFWALQSPLFFFFISFSCSSLSCSLEKEKSHTPLAYL